jgi:hypothetical protein
MHAFTSDLTVLCDSLPCAREMLSSTNTLGECLLLLALRPINPSQRIPPPPLFPQCLQLITLPAATGEAARDALRAAVGEGEYFAALLPDGSRLVHPIPFGQRFPLDFGRQALAELAGRWRVCVGDYVGYGKLAPFTAQVNVDGAPAVDSLSCAPPTPPAVLIFVPPLTIAPNRHSWTQPPSPADAPERADWRNCQASKEEEAGRTERFKEAFSSYDIMAS